MHAQESLREPEQYVAHWYWSAPGCTDNVLEPQQQQSAATGQPVHTQAKRKVSIYEQIIWHLCPRHVLTLNPPSYSHWTNGRTDRYLLTLPGLSRLSPNAFKTVFTQLHHRSPRSAASKRTGGPRPNVPGPVTLVVPYDTPMPTRDQRDYGGNVGPSSSALSVSAAAAATATAAASAHRAAALVLERAWANLAASKTAEAAAEGAMNAAAKTAAAVASAVRDGGGRLPLHPSDGDDSVSTMSGGGSGDGSAGGGGYGGGGPGRPPHPEKREAAAAAELVPLQITFGTAAADRADAGARSEARSEGPKVRKFFRKRGDITQGHRRANTPPPQQGDFFLWHHGKPVASSLSGREEAGTGSSPSQIRAPRRLDALAASAGRDSIGEDAGKGEAWSSGSSEAIEWDVDGLEVTEWLRESLLSGPGMPGLVVDLWSPGALFLRRVEVRAVIYCNRVMLPVLCLRVIKRRRRKFGDYSIEYCTTMVGR